MAKAVFTQKRWVGGFADYPKEGLQGDSYFSGTAMDYRNDPQSLTILPGALKESGTIVTDLLKWADTVPDDLSVYSYGDTGNIYKRTSAGSWSNLRTAAQSHGNGLAYFNGDDYLYYTTDSSLGRYGKISGASPQFSDNFLGAQGGVPQNTKSLSLAATSSMYAHRADTATLHPTGDITLEAFFKATTLPVAGSSMTLIGKWDESGATRSYKLDLAGVSGYFGNGQDGALTISADTTETVIDSACTGTAGSQSLSATNAGFTQGQVIEIFQMMEASFPPITNPPTLPSAVGYWERNTVQGYTAGTITLGTPLVNTYVANAQVRVVPQYTNVTINSGKTYTAKAWNGTVGGVLAFLANGTFTNNGTMTATGCGFRGGSTHSSGGAGSTGNCGEGTAGPKDTAKNNTQGNGGGAGNIGADSAGGGGGNGTAGTQGQKNVGGNGGVGGIAYGSTDLTTMVMGGGGGGGMSDDSTAGAGGNGGGIIFVIATTITNAGGIISNGNVGTVVGGSQAGGGGGAGGSILLKAQVATLGSGLIVTSGAVGGSQSNCQTGGTGGSGRIHLDYLTSFTGTTSPTLDATQDNSLVTTTTIQARLGISNNGTSFEYLTQNLNNLTTGTWNRLSVSWASASSLATFYLNAISLGTFTGTKTSISNNASDLYIGSDKGAAAVQDFFDGLLDDVRIWSNVQSASQIFINNLRQLTGSNSGLNAYWEFNGDYTDSSGNVNTLTAVNAPTFSNDVPFTDPSTRLDIDLVAGNPQPSGQTYTLPTSISESPGDFLSFSPLLDPQKSITFFLNTKGTGDWTVTIHDIQNNVITSVTVVNANLPTGGPVGYEFIFPTPWRIVIGKTYHVHLTSTVGDGKVVTSVLNDLTKAAYITYFQFLVTDTQFHPIVPFLNKIVIGNERYLATWDGASYNANLIAFPPLTHVRCFGFWREYIAVGTWQEVASGTPNVFDWPKGKIYFWDGISLTFNFSIDVPEGQVNAMFGMDTNLYLFAGWKGDLLLYAGGFVDASYSALSDKIKRIPLQQRSDFVDIYPGAINMWRSLLHFGAVANSSSTTILRGVYTWGTLNRLYEQSMSLDYPISTGNTGSSVSIGLVYPIGQSLLIGWKDGSGTGCDVVNFNNNPAGKASIETLIMDNNQIYKEKLPMVLLASHLPLKSGESVNVRYKIDRNANWTSLPTANSTIGSKQTILQIPDGRGIEYQFGTDLYTTGSTSPTLLGLSAYIDAGEEEQQFG